MVLIYLYIIIKSVGLQLKRNTVQIKNGCNEFDHKLPFLTKYLKLQNNECKVNFFSLHYVFIIF